MHGDTGSIAWKLCDVTAPGGCIAGAICETPASTRGVHVQDVGESSEEQMEGCDVLQAEVVHVASDYAYEDDDRRCKSVVCAESGDCLLYTSPSPRDLSTSRMPSSA